MNHTLWVQYRPTKLTVSNLIGQFRYVYYRNEEGHFLTVVLTPGTLDECVLSVKEDVDIVRILFVIVY